MEFDGPPHIDLGQKVVESKGLGDPLGGSLSLGRCKSAESAAARCEVYLRTF
jgi:hypothetical protein